MTAEARDLVYGWEDPGGFKSCQVPLDRPLNIQPDEITMYGQLTVYDGRDRTILFDGRLEDPSRSAGPDGQVWNLTAMGGHAHTRDRTLPLIYIDNPLAGGLDRIGINAAGGTDTRGDDPGGSGKDAVILQFPQGQTLATGARVAMRYRAIWDAGQKLARIDYSWDAGVTDAGYTIEGLAGTGTGTAQIPRAQTLTTTGGASSPRVVVADFDNGRNVFYVRLVRGGAGVTVGNDNVWVAVTDMSAVAMRYLANGNEKTTGYGPTVLASEVVADLLGRVLTKYDPATSTIAATSYAIDQLAYPDGVSADKVLDDLMALEAGYTWRVWELGPGGYRFEWVPRPTTVRYEADVTDGYDSQGSGGELYNQVTVRWRDSAGRVQATVRTSSVRELTAAALVRQGSIDLGSDVGSLAAAQRAGDQWLAQHQFAPNAGRLRIARPILDIQTGRMVMPWEIRPGLIRVRGILPRVDALNATDRDGVTVFRIVSSEYRTSEGAASLALDSYERTTPRMIAGLIKQMPSSRRR
ncbi:hypothetical protein OOK41_08990 [Micromonospora sp. NBC_01655]|uniref:hypothetical protein n=1 Tax=Micromonospora sp. NBC_01655 TaxID=2975983 RepID=UPI0022511A30|nr:hypothetical protein [Micromonospora sp. NBC_01655]MCX4470440.1 hypothetical protein [Micromonospora sp. NBC_01655]